MPALADLFKTCYLTGGSGVEFSAIRLHYRGVDDICRAFGATALTVGTDIYFRREAFAPHTPEGLRLLAHEVAHVVQQHRRPVTAGPAEEREADAPADALLRGRRFDFGAAGIPNGCWCMYWRIGPRYRDRPRADNKEDLRQLAASGRPPGLLAFDGDRAVGWCELAPRADLAWLARARYLGPVDNLPVWSVPCFYVRSSHRGRGVMDALIEAALPTAATAGAPALESYPVDTTVPSHTGNLFPGIAAAFARHGFEVVARRKPDRPVMRKLLGDVRDFST